MNCGSVYMHLCVQMATATATKDEGLQLPHNEHRVGDTLSEKDVRRRDGSYR